MKKTYVIDTNILIQNPNAFQCFEDNYVVLPLVVVEELDSLKKQKGKGDLMPGVLFAYWKNTACRAIF